MTGVDPNPFMFQYARDAAANAGLPAEDLRLLEGVAEALPLPDDSFDLVICTLVRHANHLLKLLSSLICIHIGLRHNEPAASVCVTRLASGVGTRFAIQLRCYNTHCKCCMV